jgi:ABC-type nitrate/sulfonate/bicarbonate transport system permease component
MATSLTEVLAGVGIAAVLVFFLTKFSSDRPRMRNVVRLLIPYTYVIPVLASLFALAWPTPVRIAFGVALISIYPSMEVIWRSANSQGYRCIPMAIADALPFGYVGMFFGEAMFSTAGVYLLIISSRSQQTTASTAVAWVVLVVLSHLFLSCVFRWLAYRSASQKPKLASVDRE